MVIPPFFCFEGTVYDVTNLACGVAHFQAECLAHYSPVRVAHIAPESLAHFTPVEVAHYAPVCSEYLNNNRSQLCEKSRNAVNFASYHDFETTFKNRINHLLSLL